MTNLKLANVFIAICAAIYAVLKLLPQQKKAVFISRRHDFTSIDFQLLSQQVLRDYPHFRVVILNHPMHNKVFYVLKLIIQMYHLATAKAAVLDSYTISVSILKHKKSLTILQIWHALGAVKNFGYQAIGKREGAGEQIAQTMRMHHNYTFVSAPSEATAQIYQKSFDVRPAQIVIAGSPRIDYLQNAAVQEQSRRSLVEKYSIDPEKKVILYAPTFRKRSGVRVDELVSIVNLHRYHLVFRPHPQDKKTIVIDDRVIVAEEHEVLELLSFTDYLVTDYSAVVFEAAVLNIPVFFWAFDGRSYEDIRGFALDYHAEMPNTIHREAVEIIKAIEAEEWSSERLGRFTRKYLETLHFANTVRLSKLAIEGR